MRQSMKQALSETLKSALETRTLDKITIKDLVTECGVNRQTFYYHFSDIYDLMEWTLDEDLKLFLANNPILSGDTSIDWKEQIFHFYRFLQSRKRTILHAYDPIDKVFYHNFMNKYISPIMAHRIAICENADSVPNEKREFIQQVYTWICSDLILEWIERGMPDEQKIRLDDYITLVDGSLDAALNRFI